MSAAEALQLWRAGRRDEAESLCAQLARDPRQLDAISLLAEMYNATQRLPQELATLRLLAEGRPRDASVLRRLGNALLTAGSFEEALASYETSLEYEPGNTRALNNSRKALLGLGNALLRQKRYEEAGRIYERASAHGLALGAKLACCDWTDHEAALDRVIAGVRAGQPVVHPFSLLWMYDDPELQLKCTQLHVSGASRQLWDGAIYRHEKIRVAYLSADYYEHATANLTAGLFEAHDRGKFEITGISYGPTSSGPMRARLERGFDRFIDVRGMNDTDIVSLIRSLEIDIAVDLNGHTTRGAGVMLGRAAPIQVNYLGYPGTMGIQEVDYILADPLVLPLEQQAHYTERIVHLPDSYQVNDSKRPVSPDTPTRSMAGLPDEAFVFCCFNSPHKITPAVFDTWMEVLQRVPGSLLWLLEDNSVAVRNLRREAEARAVSADRLIFAPRMRAEDHLARHRCADLFLDTLPYNAHTTASDALWAGLPVLSCLGKAFPGRVAASLLHAVGLPELVSSSRDEYLELAVELAANPARLNELRVRLALNRSTAPLFDTQRFCRNLEVAYTKMWHQQQARLPPQSFAVGHL